MTATAAQIAQVRRMVAEPTTTTYSDILIISFIEAYPLMDENGEEPYTWSSATPPAKVTNTEWVSTYDLAAAAADIWEEKAASVAVQYDFSADGGNYSRSQMYDMAMKQAKYYRGKRSMRTIVQHKKPEENNSDFSWIGNLPEDGD